MCGSGFSDKVSGPLNGTAEHHAEDHPEDLWRRREQVRNPISLEVMLRSQNYPGGAESTLNLGCKHPVFL